MSRRSLFLILCLVFLFLLVEGYEWISPLPARKWNTTNLKEIRVADTNDFSFAVFGDNRDSTDVFENLLSRIDHDRDINFAISLGDTVQKGNKARYRWFLQQIRANLGIPLLITMGHHEYQGDGPDLYRALIGPLYYSFKIGNTLFLFLDDRDGKGIDPVQKAWLLRELETCGSPCTPLVFQSMPLYDPRKGRQKEGLPENSSEELIKLFSSHGVRHIFTSHIQGCFQGQWSGIPFTITGGAGAPVQGNNPDHVFFHYLKVHVRNGQVDVKVEKTALSLEEEMDHFSYNAWIYISSFFRFHWVHILLLLMAVGPVIAIHRGECRKGSEAAGFNRKKSQPGSFGT